MTDKQIIIDYENICENYSKEVGCYNTFDGSCIKEQCFTYRLLQLLKAKEQECEELKKQHQGDKGLITSTGKMNYQLIQEYDKLKNCLTEIKEIAEKSCCLQPTSDCEEYENCNECSRTSDDETVKQILKSYKKLARY